MNSRELNLLRVGVILAFCVGVEVGQQRHFAEERLGGVVLPGEAGDLLDVLKPRVVVGELVLQIILVPGGDNHADEMPRSLGLLVVELAKRLGELLPAKRGFFRRLAGDVAQRLGQVWPLGQARAERRPKLGRRLGPDARQHQHDALERQFVAGVDEEL